MPTRQTGKNTKQDQSNPPRVRMSYEVVTDHGTEQKELPFVVGVMGDFSGNSSRSLGPLKSRSFMVVDRASFNTVMARLNPTVNLDVQNILRPDHGRLHVELRFRTLADFEPVNVIRQIEPLRNLLNTRQKLRDLLATNDHSENISILLAELAAETSNLGHGGEADRQLQLAAGADLSPEEVSRSAELPSSPRASIAALDAVLSKQLAEVMHSPDFQQLEGTWRGLHYLVHDRDMGPQIEIKVLHYTKGDLSADLEQAADFEQSELYTKIYKDVFGVPGGVPYGVLIGDYEFTYAPEDFNLLIGLTKVSAAAFCPLISAASPRLFGLKNWAELVGIDRLERIFDRPEYAGWRSFRESEEARYVVLTLPRTLARLPYGASDNPVEEFAFEEIRPKEDDAVSSPHRHEFCWMNTAYVMAARLTAAFVQHGWCAPIRGVEGGGRVDGLFLHTFSSKDGALDIKCPMEIQVDYRLEADLAKLGFMPLCYCKNTDYAVFLSAQSVHQPKKWRQPEALANAKFSATLPNVMVASRIAQYVAIIAKDSTGAYQDAKQIEARLNRWLAKYTATNLGIAAGIGPTTPLANAHADVRESPAQPGNYDVTLSLQPHLQMESLSASLKMVVSIRETAASQSQPGLLPNVTDKPEMHETERPLKPHLDENVQFTVYRPKRAVPDHWYSMLVFAHLDELPFDAPADEPDPIEAIRKQAKAILGEQLSEYLPTSQESQLAVPREGEIAIVPEVPGITFYPPRQEFLWLGRVHHVEFQLRASEELDGQVARGRLTVFLGHILLATIPIAIRVDRKRPAADIRRTSVKQQSIRPYRKIFASYSHKDVAIVEEFEQYGRAIGDTYLRDATSLRAGEHWHDKLEYLIDEADVFQLFWSTNAMYSNFVEHEWRYALSLKRDNFVRPTFWEEPLPTDPERELPPRELIELHFQQLTPEKFTSSGIDETTVGGSSPEPHEGDVPGARFSQSAQSAASKKRKQHAPKGKKTFHEKLQRVRSSRVHIAYENEPPIVGGVPVESAGGRVTQDPATGDRKRGSLLGLAWGDIFGCPVEGWWEGDISNIYGSYESLPEEYPLTEIALLSPRKLRRLRPLGLHSDDTQQALALARVCMLPDGWSPESWAKVLIEGKKVTSWRGYGRNFALAMRALQRGVSPRESGSRSAGIGAAMRIGPLGAIYADRPEELAIAAIESSLVTHGDIRAATFAFAVAAATAALVHGASVDEVWAKLPEQVAKVETEWLEGRQTWTIDRSAGNLVSTTLQTLADAMPTAPAGIRARVSELARPHLAPGFTRAHPNQGFVLLGGLHAVAMALLPEVRPQDILAEIVRQGYDTDTVAAIAGGLLGARFGTDWIPMNRFLDRLRLEEYANAIAAGHDLPENQNKFLRRESELTQLEREYQRRLMES